MNATHRTFLNSQGAIVTDPQYTPPPSTPYTAGAPQTQKKTLSLLALIFGIVGIVLSLLLGLFGVPFDIAAIVLGFLGRSRENAKGQALTGIVLGFVGILVAIVSVILAFVLIAATQGTTGTTLG